MYEHKNALINGFTKKYHINKLVYNECFSNMKDAILREKQIKAWRREKKIALIESTNPSWNELSI
jgi:putative endonuclease